MRIDIRDFFVRPETTFEVEVYAFSDDISSSAISGNGTTKSLYAPQNPQAGFRANGQPWLKFDQSSTRGLQWIDAELYKNGVQQGNIYPNLILFGGQIPFNVAFQQGEKLHFRIRGARKSLDGTTWYSPWVTTNEVTK